MQLNQYTALYKGAESPALSYGESYLISVGIGAAGYFVQVGEVNSPIIYKTFRDYQNDWNVIGDINEIKGQAATVIPVIPECGGKACAKTSSVSFPPVTFRKPGEFAIGDLITDTETISKKELADALMYCLEHSLDRMAIIARLSDQFLSGD